MTISFLYPSFLWALLFVTAPILLHLFNFRRFKKVYFSNVDLLKEIKEDSKKARNIKNWLILLLRVLFIIFLVLAFAFPFTGNEADDKNKTLSIYIDNSFSMDNEGVEGNKLNNAKAFADKLIQNISPNTKVHIVTNDFKGKHQNKFNKKQAQEEVSKIQPTPVSRSFQNVMNRQSLFFQNNLNKKPTLYWISDFQQLDNKHIDNPDSFNVNLGFLRSSEETNISIDSVWFDSPVRKKMGTEILKFKISNYSSEIIKNQNVKLNINNRISSMTIANLIPGKTLFDFEFQIPKDSIINGSLSIEDENLLFDNEMVFSYLIPNRQKVCLIAQPNSNIIKSIKKVFTADSSIELSIVNPVEIDFNQLGLQDFVILGELNLISQNLAIELFNLAERGKVVGIIPGANIDQQNYNNSFKLWGEVKIQSKDTSLSEIGNIQKSHSFFKDVFEARKTNKNIKESFPTLYMHYNLKPSLNSETIIFNEDGSPYLITSNNFYYFGSGFSKKQSNMEQKALIVPLLYQMVFKSINTTPIQYYIMPGTKLEVPYSKKRSLNIISENQTTQVRVNNNSTRLPLNLNKGYHQLNNENQIISSLGLNYSREENLSIDKQNEYLEELQNSLLFSKIEISGNQSSNNIKLSTSENTYWFACLIAALSCLLAEMILLRIKI